MWEFRRPHSRIHVTFGINSGGEGALDEALSHQRPALGVDHRADILVGIAEDHLVMRLA